MTTNPRSDLLVIVPSRGRPQAINELMIAWNATGTQADLLVGLDDDDVPYPREEGVMYDVGPRQRFAPMVNRLTDRYAGSYRYVAVLGDDHRPRTPSWDAIMSGTLAALGSGVVYGDDLLRGREMATAVMMTTDLPRGLGYIAPPGITHLYVDNFWMSLGRAVNGLRYLPEVTIEHLHFSAGKSGLDATYTEANDQRLYEEDGRRYREYMRREFRNEMMRLKRIIPAVTRRHILAARLWSRRTLR